MNTLRNKKCRYCEATYRQSTTARFKFPHCQGERKARLVKFGKLNSELPVDAIKKIADWLVGPDTSGASSTMAAIALGLSDPTKMYGGFFVPKDSADFGRCKKLVEQIPEIRKAFSNIERAHRPFAPYIENFDALCLMHEQGLFRIPADFGMEMACGSDW